MQQRVIVCASPQGTGFKVKIVQQHCYSRALLLAVFKLASWGARRPRARTSTAQHVRESPWPRRHMHNAFEAGLE